MSTIYYELNNKMQSIHHLHRCPEHWYDCGYLRQGGNIFASVCPSVLLSMNRIMQTFQAIFMKFV